MNERAPVAIIGAGPAGLMAADVLSAAGARVVVFERMPSVARKFLMAGRGGLNLTHSEPFEAFLARYGAAAAHLLPILEAFTPGDLIAWAHDLEQETFVGSSGRIFPKAMKASPLLRAWLLRLQQRGVEIRTRTRWTGWNADGALTFEDGESFAASATLLALGGASWPRLGADGHWTAALAQRGVALAPFQPANVGFDIAWSEHFRERFSGQPLKHARFSFGVDSVVGEAVITAYGIEGGAVYALSQKLRDAAAPVTLHIDLKPALSAAELATRLSKARKGDSLSNTLRKSAGLSPLAIGLLREAHGTALTGDAGALGAAIKACPLTLTAPRGLERAISSAGGVRWDAVNQDLELRAIPGVFVAGEMLDWEAPTGGYLLQACFATGAWAAHAILGRGSGLAMAERR